MTGLTHFDLLNHPAVYEQLRTWIMRAGPVRSRVPSEARWSTQIELRAAGGERLNPG